jgi:hypothetical protein
LPPNERQQFPEPPLGLQELDVLNTRLEEMAREIRRLRAWREAISAGDNVRATSITGTVGGSSGGTGVQGSVLGGVSIWQNNSGGVRTQGTVVTRNGDRTFGVTTTVADTTAIGVLDGGTDGTASVAVSAEGRVRHLGYQTTVTVQGAVTANHFLRASATAGAAEDAGAASSPGVFAVALTAAAGPGAGTVSAFVFAGAQLGPGDAVAFPRHVTGRYYSGTPGNAAVNTVTVSANTLYGVMLYVPERKTYTNIAIEVTAGAGTLARLGIYRDSAGQPGALIADCGTVSTAGVAAVGIGINVTLDPGWVWLVADFDGTPDVRSLAVGTTALWMGFSTAGDTSGHIGVSAAFAFAALPSTFPASSLSTASIVRIMLSP